MGRALFVLFLALTWFFTARVVPIEIRAGVAFFAVLLGALLEHEIHDYRDEALSTRVFWSFLGLCAFSICILGWAAESEKLASLLMLVSFGGFGAEVSSVARTLRGRRLRCAECHHVAGRWDGKDLESFASWKCPSCSAVGQLHAHPEPTTTTNGAPYREPTGTPRPTRSFEPKLVPIGIEQKWLRLGVAVFVAVPILYLMLSRGP